MSHTPRMLVNPSDGKIRHLAFCFRPDKSHPAPETPARSWQSRIPHSVLATTLASGNLRTSPMGPPAVPLRLPLQIDVKPAATCSGDKLSNAAVGPVPRRMPQATGSRQQARISEIAKLRELDFILVNSTNENIVAKKIRDYPLSFKAVSKTSAFVLHYLSSSSLGPRASPPAMSA